MNTLSLQLQPIATLTPVLEPAPAPVQVPAPVQAPEPAPVQVPAPVQTPKAIASQVPRAERIITNKLTKLGATEKAVQTLVNSGLPTGMAVVLAETVFKLAGATQGFSTRMKWFSEALLRRYGHRLEAAKQNDITFCRIVHDMERVVDGRDRLKEGGYNLSFEEAFMLDEAGINENEYDDLVGKLTTTGVVRAKMRIITACKRLLNGECATIEAALFAYESEG